MVTLLYLISTPQHLISTPQHLISPPQHNNISTSYLNTTTSQHHISPSHHNNISTPYPHANIPPHNPLLAWRCRTRSRQHRRVADARHGVPCSRDNAWTHRLHAEVHRRTGASRCALPPLVDARRQLPLSLRAHRRTALPPAYALHHAALAPRRDTHAHRDTRPCALRVQPCVPVHAASREDSAHHTQHASLDGSATHRPVGRDVLQEQQRQHRHLRLRARQLRRTLRRGATYY